jgi:ABC-2 type transport system permease protein
VSIAEPSLPSGKTLRVATNHERPNPDVIRAILWKDLTAVRRAKAVILPMMIVPGLLLVALPFVLTLIAVQTTPDVANALGSLPGNMAEPILKLPRNQQAIMLIDGYLLAPMFLIVPLMVSAVMAADAFAGEKERKTLEHLLHLPVTDRELFIAKVIGAFLPSVLVSWVGFACFVVVANATAWPVMHRVFVPTSLWLVMIGWVAPAVATLGLGVMVRVSARTRSTQEANQLGGAVILPLIFLALGQSTGLLLVDLPIAIGLGAVVWLIGLLLVRGGIRRFTRDRLALST